jgi:hypothetical protein
MQRAPLLWLPLYHQLVFLANGEAKDLTRPPAFYDEAYAFLVACGIAEI